MNGGQFDEARAAFSAMGDYGDAKEQLAACDYQEALSLLETGGVDALVQAEADFAALGDYQDSAERLKQATYALGQAYLEEGSYELPPTVSSPWAIIRTARRRSSRPLTSRHRRFI